MGRLTTLFPPLEDLRQEIDSLFENTFFAPAELIGNGIRASGEPALNVWADAENAYVEAEIPGLAQEDVEVLVTGNELTLAGERRIVAPDAASWHRRERPAGRFVRTLALPWQIDAGKVEAKLRDGVLTIRLPKAESAKPKKVKLLTA